MCPDPNLFNLVFSTVIVISTLGFCQWISASDTCISWISIRGVGQLRAWKVARKRKNCSSVLFCLQMICKCGLPLLYFQQNQSRDAFMLSHDQLPQIPSTHCSLLQMRGDIQYCQSFSPSVLHVLFELLELNLSFLFFSSPPLLKHSIILNSFVNWICQTISALGSGCSILRQSPSSIY